MIQRGYSILVMLAMVTMISLYAIVSQLEVASRRYVREEATMKSLALAKEALIGYAVTYRDNHATEVFGYLPCPDSSDKSGLYHPGDGTAAGSCGNAGQASIGLLPYKTLGLPDLRDADGYCLWYAVSGSHKNSPKGSSASAPILMNWDAQGQFSVMGQAGNLVSAPDDAQGGVVAVIFAPGAALAGQTRSATGYPCAADPARYSDYLDGAYSFPNTGATFVQGSRASASNNDVLMWLSAKEIFDRIRLRADFRNLSTGAPAGQINRFLEETSVALEKLIQDDLLIHAGIPTHAQPTALKPPATNVPYAAYYQQYSGKLIGEPPNVGTLGDSSYDAYLTNWREHLRYAVCSSLTAGCLTVAGQSGCRGILLFGGERVGGGPRPSSEKVPAAFPASPSPLTAYLADYFEANNGTGGLDMLASAGTTFSGANAYSDTHRSADAGSCLFPGAFISFGNDIGNFSRAISNANYPAAAINAAAQTISLGQPAAISATGCAWYPNPLSLNTKLRAYFKFSIASRGEGFVFAIADANPARNSLPPGCGATAGGSLGYAGGAINYPKIGLETDSRSSSAQNDPSSNHFAFVYWGGASSGSDDNTHAAGSRGSGSEPYNPRSLTSDTGISSVKSSDPNLPYGGTLPINADIHVRLDLTRTYPSAPGQGQYQLQAYVAAQFLGCQLTDFQNLSQDMSMLCKQAAKISDVIVIDDIAGLGPAMQNVYVGFTTAQDASSPQQISISDLLIRSF